MPSTSLSLDPEPLARIVALGYEAPLHLDAAGPGEAAAEQAAWQEFASEAARAFGCQLAMVEYIDPARPDANFIATGGLDGFGEVFAAARRRHDDDSYLEAIQDRPDGTVLLGAEIVTPEEMHRSRSYAALALPWHLEHFLFGKIMTSGAGGAFFSLGRTAREAPFVAGDKQLVGNIVLGHLARSFGLRKELAAMRGASTLLSALMQQAPTGLVLFDALGRPVLVNQKASDIFARRDGLALADGKLRADGPGTQGQLDAALETVLRIARGNPLPPPTGIAVARRGGVKPYRVAFSLLKPLAPGAPGTDAAVIALIHDERRAAPQAVPAVFRATYGLTRAEVCLCEALLEGRTLCDAAANLGIKRNTAKTHLARIFDKTGVRSQLALLRLLALGARA
ncbi:MAG: hypothetical protein J0M16_03315 [Gammaproteobacteria bacterium]|nr:hypothetical protein [Gammaproteobacteria bacterium]